MTLGLHCVTYKVAQEMVLEERVYPGISLPHCWGQGEGSSEHSLRGPHSEGNQASSCLSPGHGQLFQREQSPDTVGRRGNMIAPLLCTSISTGKVGID